MVIYDLKTSSYESVIFSTWSQDESDDRIQETLLVGYEYEEAATHPPKG